ncbi:MAG: sialate O-acetylesterase [Sphingobacteriales bacterium]|nr:MAG: sialate O-acetylesterase [Sphingobacteriales bacterium]TAF82709.1 MAG: sialate O-acetylesterase [Sphingobacteriales bacterium]
MKVRATVLVLLLIWGGQNKTYAQTLQHLKVAHIFSHNMVLQRQVNTPIWGWAKADTKVNILFANTITTAITNAAGKWMAYLPAQKAGGPYHLKIYQTNDTITINNVLVGDVWLAAGQSNMGWQLDWGVLNKDEAIKNSTNPNIRFFTVADDLNNKPQPDVSGGEWVESNPKTSPQFSALAYFFAQDLQKKLNIPIGIIHSSWGGTKIESWMSTEMLKTHPEYASAMATQIADTTNFDNGYEKFNATNTLRDSILKYSENGINQKVFAPNYDDSTWQTIILPAKLTSVGINNFYGYCWFRKTVNIPPRETKKDFILTFGEISNENICYVNGQKVERLNQNPMIQYTVPHSILKSGNNQITIRVLARYGVGGFDSKANDLFAQSNNKKFKITLAGNWKFNQNIEPQTPLWAEPYNSPAYIYNAKIAPLLPYALKGIIWYQGESNDKNAPLYQSLFPILINNWRSQLNQAKLPFIYGQLANYGAKTTMPVEKSNTAIVRNAQLQTLSLPNTAMVVNIDLGLDEDVHFKNKQACGQRFALAALDIAYKHDNSFITPIFKSSKTKGNSICLSFSANTQGFKSKNNQPLKGFAIRSAMGKFVWAKAKIKGKQIIVWANSIAKPTAVRYAWANNPTCNLLTLDGLPVSPFKTD